MATCFGRPCNHHQARFYRSCAFHARTIWDPIMCTNVFFYRLKSVLDKNSCFIIYVSYCILKSTTFHIDHYTVHIPRGCEFTIGCVTTNRHKLISLESKQSIICHCTVCITVMSKITNYRLLCRISYIIPYLLVCYLSDAKLRITWPTMCSQLLLLGCPSVPGVRKFGSMYPVRIEV
jgi:hypothetical protein